MKVTGDIKKITVTQRQLAAALGITPARVNHLIKDGIVVRDEDNSGGAVYLCESLKRYWAGKANQDAAVKSELNLTQEKARYERIKREIAELRLARMEGRAYSAHTVELVMTEMLSNLRTQLQGIPSKLAPLLDGADREKIHGILSREIEEKLMELSEYRPELFTEEVTDNGKTEISD